MWKWLRTGDTNHRISIIPRDHKDWIIALLALALVLTGTLGAYGAYVAGEAKKDFASYVGCQAQWSTDFRNSIEANRNASKDLTAKLHDVFVLFAAGLVNPDQPGIKIKFVHLLDKYNAAYDKYFGTAAQEPLPPTPEEQCGKEPTQ